MQAILKWQDGMKFTGSADSGFPVTLDTLESFGGNNSAPTPMELILLGLAGCTAMDVISILKKKRREVTRFEVRAEAGRAGEHPKVFTSAVIHYQFDGKNIDEESVLRAIELSVTKYCPAHAMLSKAFPISCHYEIYEEGKLLKRGEWKPT